MNNVSSLNSDHNTIVKFETFNFGPMICYTKLKQSFIEELKSRGDKSKVSFKHDLAGHLDEENEYSQEDKSWFMNSTSEIFKTYVGKLSKFSLNEMGNKPPVSGINLYSLWINYMKKYEFNPIHDHSGDISFVIYLKVPEGIKEESENFVGQGVGPGCIGFYYGEKVENMRTQHHFFPTEGDMFLFPAATKHMVPPFMSEGTRISVSGNLSFDYGKISQ